MAQQRYRFNGYEPIRQPTSVEFSYAVTSTADSGNNQYGVMKNVVMFTKEAYKITFERLKSDEVSEIMQRVLGRGSIEFYYYSPHYGRWRTDQFYVANLNGQIATVKEGKEGSKSLSFQITGINPI